MRAGPKSPTSVIPAKSLPRTRYGAGIHPRHGAPSQPRKQSNTPPVHIRWGIWGVKRRLERDGWYLDRHGSSHDIYRHPSIPGIVIPFRFDYAVN